MNACFARPLRRVGRHHGNEDGQQCTINNPCEVDADGNITVDQGAAYGQQTWWLYTCLTANRTIDLNKSGCELPKPARRH